MCTLTNMSLDITTITKIMSTIIMITENVSVTIITTTSMTDIASTAMIMRFVSLGIRSKVKNTMNTIMMEERSQARMIASRSEIKCK